MIAPRFPGGTLRLRPKNPAPPPSSPAVPDPTEIAERKVANVQREREAHEAAVARKREQTREVLELLSARWPAVFSIPVPLAIGIQHKIRAAMGEERISTLRLSRAIHRWTHGPSYLVAVAAGQRRVNLDGTDAGEPDEAAREYARGVLAERAARRGKPKYHPTVSLPAGFARP